MKQRNIKNFLRLFGIVPLLAFAAVFLASAVPVQAHSNAPHTITASAGAGGSISPSGSVSVNWNTDQTFSITPDTGYNIADVQVDGFSVGALGTYQFTNVKADHTISASFVLKTYSISTSVASGSGSISPVSAIVSHGGSKTFTISPGVGYHITDVKVDNVSVGAVSSYTFSNVTAPHALTANFAINTYTITNTANAGGTISPSSTVNYGSNVTVNIAADPGYFIQNVVVDGVSKGAISSWTFNNVIANHTVAASFGQIYTITASAGAGGSINPSGAVSVNSGTSKTFTITPDATHNIGDVLVDGVSQGAVTSWTFEAVSQDHTIAASFLDKPVRKVYIQCSGTWEYVSGLWINRTGAQACMGGTFTPASPADVIDGGSITITFTPNEGRTVYQVCSGVLGGALTCQQGIFSLTLNNVTSDMDVRVQWDTTLHTITASAGANGSISPSGAVDASGYNDVPFVITPNPGYDIASITVNGVPQAITNNQSMTYTFTAALISSAENHTISATFTPHVYQISVTATAGGTVSPAGPTVNVTYGGSQSFTITPDPGYITSSVKVDGAEQGAVTSWLFDPVAANHTLDVTFTQLASYDITAVVGAGGSITPAGGAAIAGGTTGTVAVTHGTNKLFTITPQAGKAILDVKAGPTGGALTSVLAQLINSTYTFMNITRDMTINATFASAYSITTSVVAGADSNTHGTINPGGSVNVLSGTDKTFYIVPDSGYVVSNVVVDGASQGAISSYTFSNVSAAHSISASFALGGAAMSEYCNLPPFVFSSIKPNLLLMIDNSASMYDLAYIKPNSLCYDDSYSSAQTYAGYFTTSALYSYDDTNGKFVPGAAISLTGLSSCDSLYVAPPDPYDPAWTPPNTSSCYYTGGSGPDVAVIMNAGTQGSRTVQSMVASGNFLNWLTASKLDIQKMVLTGGKYDTARGVLASESRGCLGDRFAKQVKDGSGVLQGVTFAIKGPSSFDPENVNRTIQGGKTQIQIFDKSYLINKSWCDQAMVDWQNNVDMSNDLFQCSGFYDETFQSQGVQRASYNQTIQNCIDVKNGIAPSQMNAVKNHCGKVIVENFPGSGTPPGDPALITNKYSAVGMCGSIFTHDAFVYTGSYPSYIPNSTGFLGKCWTPGNPFGTWNDTCATTEMIDYCKDMATGVLVDPSYLELSPNQASPSYFVDAGISSLGPVAKTYDVYVAADTPKGLVNEFKDLINFGVMIFNYDGSGSEHPALPVPYWCASDHNLICTPNSNSCPANDCVVVNPPSDGGYVKYHIDGQVGDHNAGLIHEIDEIKGNSWTPFGEAFYNAMGYLAPVKKCGGTGILCYSDVDCASFNNQCMLTGNSATNFTFNATTYNYKFSGQTAAALSYDEGDNPTQVRCQKNFIMVISDGMPTADRNTAVNDFVSAAHTALAGTIPSSQTGWLTGGTDVVPYSGSRNLDDLAWLAKNKNIANLDMPIKFNSDFITSYAVYTGEPCRKRSLADDPTQKCVKADNSAETDETVPEHMMQLTAKKGGGVNNDGTLKTYFSARDPIALITVMKKAFGDIASETNSGTAASILSNSEGSGANILQAIFYPKKSFDDGVTNSSWLGELHNLWYYVDPFIGNSTMRENTADPAAAAADTLYLNLKSDYELRFNFDDATGETTVQRWQDVNGDGSGELGQGTVSPDYIKSLWRAGLKLWSTAPGVRNIYTHTAGTLLNFNAAFAVGNPGILQAGADTDLATQIVRFTRGEDFPGYRERNIYSLTIGADGDYDVSASKNVWKLGDIISSTPRVLSSVKQNSYSIAPPAGYGDLSYGNENTRTAGYVYQNAYLNRGLVFVGANDGMLHAFKLGRLSVAASGDQKATLYGNNLGQEQWAFIPKNALPYLKYLTDRQYTHIYTVDGPTVISDVSIGTTDENGVALTGCSGNYWDCTKDIATGKNWRTVLIGSMGVGGASKISTAAGTGDFVKTPVPEAGFSSYFALDLTNQTPDVNGVFPAPVFLWEFTDPDLGYATSGPAIVKISAKDPDTQATDNTKNGRWFAVFASGPTGPIDGNTCQFKGKSEHNLFIFVVDLKTGQLLWKKDTGIANAFAGTITNGVVDTDRWKRTAAGYYQDDVIYIPFVRKLTDGWGGGILRVLTKENLTPSEANWAVSTVIADTDSTPLADRIGPLTTNVAKLQDRKNHKLWLYAGSGRYLYSGDDGSATSPANTIRRKIVGIADPCYDSSADRIDPACTATLASPSLTMDDLKDQTDDPASSLCTTVLGVTTCDQGWYIKLDNEDLTNSLGAERVITDPVSMTNGVVFFTSYKPSTDACEFGGKSYMWATQYDTGGAASSGALVGKALVQVSTGTFKQIDLAQAFTDKGNRRMGTPMTGKPPSDPPPIVTKSNLKPVKKILQIQEK